VRALGGFDEELSQLADWDLWIRLAQSTRGAACTDVVVGCLIHSGSMLLTSEDEIFDEFEYLATKHRALSEGRGARFDGALFTRWVALGHRRAGRRLRAARVYLAGAVRHRDPALLVRALAPLIGERAVDSIRRALRRPDRDGRVVESSAEPPWLGLYRDGVARNVRASVNASLPSGS
jgi:hypothetical protein